MEDSSIEQTYYPRSEKRTTPETLSFDKGVAFLTQTLKEALLQKSGLIKKIAVIGMSNQGKSEFIRRALDELGRDSEIQSFLKTSGKTMEELVMSVGLEAYFKTRFTSQLAVDETSSDSVLKGASWSRLANTNLPAEYFNKTVEMMAQMPYQWDDHSEYDVPELGKLVTDLLDKSAQSVEMRVLRQDAGVQAQVAGEGAQGGVGSWGYVRFRDKPEVKKYEKKDLKAAVFDLFFVDTDVEDYILEKMDLVIALADGWNKETDSIEYDNPGRFARRTLRYGGDFNSLMIYYFACHFAARDFDAFYKRVSYRDTRLSHITTIIENPMHPEIEVSTKRPDNVAGLVSRYLQRYDGAGKPDGVDLRKTFITLSGSDNELTHLPGFTSADKIYFVMDSKYADDPALQNVYAVIPQAPHPDGKYKDEDMVVVLPILNKQNQGKDDFMKKLMMMGFTVLPIRDPLVRSEENQFLMKKWFHDVIGKSADELIAEKQPLFGGTLKPVRPSSSEEA